MAFLPVVFPTEVAEKSPLLQIMEHSPNAPDFILREWMRTEFNLPVSIRMQAEVCFLRVWESSYVMSRVVDGTIHMSGRNWIVHWQSVPTVVADSPQVACSFREYMGKHYVVIKAWKAEAGRSV